MASSRYSSSFVGLRSYERKHPHQPRAASVLPDASVCEGGVREEGRGGLRESAV